MLKIKKIDEKLISIDKGNGPVLVHAVFYAQIMNGILELIPQKQTTPAFSEKLEAVEINGSTYTTAEEALTALEFIGNFKSGGNASPLPTLQFKVVDELPETGDGTIIYLKKNNSDDTNYVEYIWLESENRYELIGSTEIDLSGYVVNGTNPTDINIRSKNDKKVISYEEVENEKQSIVLSEGIVEALHIDDNLGTSHEVLVRDFKGNEALNYSYYDRGNDVHTRLNLSNQDGLILQGTTVGIKETGYKVKDLALLNSGDQVLFAQRFTNASGDHSSLDLKMGAGASLLSAFNTPLNKYFKLGVENLPFTIYANERPSITNKSDLNEQMAFVSDLDNLPILLVGTEDNPIDIGTLAVGSYEFRGYINLPKGIGANMEAFDHIADTISSVSQTLYHSNEKDIIGTIKVSNNPVLGEGIYVIVGIVHPFLTAYINAREEVLRYFYFSSNYLYHTKIIGDALIDIKADKNNVILKNSEGVSQGEWDTQFDTINFQFSNPDAGNANLSMDSGNIYLSASNPNGNNGDINITEGKLFLYGDEGIHLDTNGPILINNEVLPSHKFLTEEEYTALKNAGTLDDNTYYYTY